jgi:hypothetical protein
MQWYDLARKLNAFQMNDGEDILVWSCTGNRKFSVKSVYMHLTWGRGETKDSGWFGNLKFQKK